MGSYQPTRRPWSVGVANYLNLQTFPLHAEQVLVTAGVYQAFYQFGAPYISKWLAPKTYESMSEKSRTNLDMRVVSFLQSIFISAYALKVIFTDPSRINTGPLDRLWGYSSPAGSVQAYAAGYFLWDIYVTSTHLAVSGPSVLAHAICAFAVSMIGFVSLPAFVMHPDTNFSQRPFANYYGVNFVLYEMSTPFLNIHWVLDKVGKTGSDLQFYNGVCLMSTFFGCRLVWGSYQTWLLSKDMLFAWQNRGTGPFPTWLFSLYFVANTTLTGLNFFWFGKMIDAMRRRFQSKPASSEPKTT